MPKSKFENFIDEVAKDAHQKYDASSISDQHNSEYKIQRLINEVFPPEVLKNLANQQRNSIDELIKRVINSEGAEALTKPRLEGIKELITEHLWAKELTQVADSMFFLEGFVNLSPDNNLFEARAKDAFLSQLLDAIRLFTQKVPAFPLAIAIRSEDRFIVMFRSTDEDKALTESTIRALVAAYDAEEIAICFATDAYHGMKACLITRKLSTEGTAIFLELEAKSDGWVIGKPVGKISSSQLNDFVGQEAVLNFNEPFIRTRKVEAQKSLEQWMPMYKWGFS